MEFVTSGIVQALVALLLSSLLYIGHVAAAALRGAERQPWNRWLGLYLPERPRDAWRYLGAFVLIGGAFALFTRFMTPDYLEMARQTPQHRIAALTPTLLVPAALVYAFLTTGFSEELLFRGVLAKRLIAWLGYPVGNTLQALVFGLLHVGLVRIGAPGSALATQLMLGGFVTVMAFVAGWGMAERGDGSILFPWMMHAGANLATVAVYILAPVA